MENGEPRWLAADKSGLVKSETYTQATTWQARLALPGNHQDERETRHTNRSWQLTCWDSG